ncbi:SRPBCC family protein [Pseudonocardia thermophila]|uniref:SRPBCC family protein n=1 Tax=Pseudonocardia thermophila TaxID=1848 RepID=UPI00248E27E7|nr:SRPBCC domain-containing protein [Pseudonocardia thermophila]
MSTPSEIRREVALPAPPEQVWRAIAAREGQAGWFTTFDDEPWAEVVEDPPHRLEQRFGTQEIEYVIEAASGGTTVLRFVHSGVREDDWGDEWDTRTGHGWDLHLFTLGEYLRHFPGRPALYTEAEAPPGGHVRPRVLTALGDPAVGAVIDTPLGRGAVDVRTDRYVGARTDPGAGPLPRTHAHRDAARDRSPQMDPATDRQKIVDTWTAWLAEKAG